MKRLNIIQTVSYYYPKTGGQENVVKEVSERLAKKGHQVEIFTSDIGFPKDKQLKSTKKLKINYLKSFVFANTPIIPKLLFKLSKVKEDSIFHIHLPRAFIPEMVYLTSRIKKIPYIVHFHGEMYRSGRWGFLIPAYKKFVLKRVLKDANKIVCLTEDYKEKIVGEYGLDKNKIVIIPNGVNERFLVNKKNKKISKRCRLLFVGRLATEKNVSNLIEGVSLVKEKVVLSIVGDGPEKDKLKELTSEKGLKNVIFYGEKKGEELINFYKSSDIFILPSKYESFSLVLLEAMATGTPIIASNIPGTKLVIKNNYNGILINPTPEKIAEAIGKLIKNPKVTKKLAKNGSKEVKKYSWNKIVKQIESVYNEILKEQNKNVSKNRI